MRTQIGRHVVNVFEKLGEDIGVALDNRIGFVDDVEIDIAVISVDGDFDRVADVGFCR